MLGSSQRELGQDKELGSTEAMLHIVHHRDITVNVLFDDGLTPFDILDVADDRLDSNGSVWCDHGFLLEEDGCFVLRNGY
jgi:hypothetical protein